MNYMPYPDLCPETNLPFVIMDDDCCSSCGLSHGISAMKPFLNFPYPRKVDHDMVEKLVMTDLQYSKCNYPLEEPETTMMIRCPGCGTDLFIPSRKLWNDIKSNSMLN